MVAYTTSFEDSLLLSGQLNEDEVEDSKIMQYCSIDGKGKKSLGEMEQEFLQALQVMKQNQLLIRRLFSFSFY